MHHQKGARCRARGDTEANGRVFFFNGVDRSLLAGYHGRVLHQVLLLEASHPPRKQTFHGRSKGPVQTFRVKLNVFSTGIFHSRRKNAIQTPLLQKTRDYMVPAIYIYLLRPTKNNNFWTK